MKDDKVILLMLVAAAAWIYYTRTHGLSLTGQYQNTMLPQPSIYGRPDPMSSVQPSGTNSTAATNVFNAIGQLGAQIIHAISGPAGNMPATRAPSPYQVDGSTPPFASIGDPIPAYDSSLDMASPWWMWSGQIVEQPVNTGVPVMDWTLNGPVDYGYIPPPPSLEPASGSISIVGLD